MIQSPSSPSNPGEKIGELIDRFRRASGWNLAGLTEDEKLDRKQLILVFLEILGAARVPVEKYETLYRRAMVSRSRNLAEGKDVPFHLTAAELVAEWFLLEKELTINDDVDKDVSTCSFRGNHIAPDDPVVEYLFGGTEKTVLPCHECRPFAHKQRKIEATEKRNASFASRRLEEGEGK